MPTPSPDVRHSRSGSSGPTKTSGNRSSENTVPAVLKRHPSAFSAHTTPRSSQDAAGTGGNPRRPKQAQGPGQVPKSSGGITSRCSQEENAAAKRPSRPTGTTPAVATPGLPQVPPEFRWKKGDHFVATLHKSKGSILRSGGSFANGNLHVDVPMTDLDKAELKQQLAKSAQEKHAKEFFQCNMVIDNVTNHKMWPNDAIIGLNVCAWSFSGVRHFK